jgi:hypothetical protein
VHSMPRADAVAMQTQSGVGSITSPRAQNHQQLEFIGRSVDRQVTVEMRLGAYSRGVAAKLYDAALAAHDVPSLTLHAARVLRDRVGVGDIVMLASGAGHNTQLPAGETDGPLGVAALARTLHLGLGARPIFISAPEYAPPIGAAAAAAGLPNAEVLPLPPSDDSPIRAREYIDRLSPAAVIVVEVLAPNHIGVAHTASGLLATEERARIEDLIAAARAANILTIGVGDNGNEIGFGVIEAAVREHKPYGNLCRCPCASGIASAISTEVLVAANISNWGAYGVEAMLAALLQDPSLLHNGVLEQQMLDAAVGAGARDGSTGKSIPAVDGAPLEVHQALLRILHAIVENGLTEPPDRGF